MLLPEKFVFQTKNIIQDEIDDFLSALDQKSPVSVRVNDKRIYSPSDEKVRWCDEGYYLAERPLFTADPYFHAGVYYVQEASSMFLCEVLKQLVSKNSTVLDLSAAPGGKSTLISQYINEEGLLVSNEIIHSRANILAENMIKWGNDSVVVTNNEPKDFQNLPAFFDVIVVDAPCSGEGMFRKDSASINEWSLQNVTICAARQKDILTDVWDSLKEDGILIYSTCTYNKEENEKNVEWIEDELGASYIPLNINEFPEITTYNKGYRFFPYKTTGEGFFIAALRKKAGVERPRKIKNRKEKNQAKTLKNAEDFRKYLKLPDKWEIIKEENIISAFNRTKVEQLELLKRYLKIIHFGITLVEQKGKDYIPHISLALSKNINSGNFETADVEYETTISFLRRETIFLENISMGYILLKYQNIPIGWVKNVGNRCNNLYPNEWRIRMKINNTTR